ncbi:hypothetical protein PybrP1_001145 [[Pythium] brassicae (nom. inval.)]|nr:hypothetical protein PybrP1_001145 [[Pythium] brassicae (nom. inval.)]
MPRTSTSGDDNDTASASSSGAAASVSAPGKVLLTGGYLVLEPAFAGLVVASTARFHAYASQAPAADESAGEEDAALRVVVESPQFGQTIRGTLKRRVGGDGEGFAFVVRDDSDRNAYIEETLLCAINGIEGVAPNSLQASGQALSRRNLAALPAFLPPFMEEKVDGERVAMKTGMGSSAALVTALVGALVCFFVPTNRFEDTSEDLELIHNLAQLSHCFVQRKVGSGFDVSAACYGSQRFTRFPASILSAFSSPEALQPAALGACLRDREQWGVSRRIKPFKLPPGLRLLMGDVSAGSATVSMVRQVLSWMKAEPEHAQSVVAALDQSNSAVERGFEALLPLLEQRAAGDARRAMAQTSPEQWQAVDAAVGSVLVQIRESFLAVRALLREMGERAQVPIEPPEQTALVDATMAIPGVLIAGVPGAGGFDAVFVVALDESVLGHVEALWMAWPQSHPTATICPLLCDADPFRGLRRGSGLQ